MAFGLVFLWHADVWVPSWFPHGKGAASAVVFFFILSGVVTGYSSYDKAVHYSFVAVIQYVWKKILKLYPLYFITTILAISYSGLPVYIANHDFAGMKNMFRLLMIHLFLLQSWFPQGPITFNGVAWFLSSIMFLYILTVPLTACVTKIKNSISCWYIILGIVSVTAIGFTILYCYMMRESDNMAFWTYVFPPSRIGEYVCGICLGYIVHNLSDKIPSMRLYKIFFSLAEIIVLFIWIYALYIPAEDWYLYIVPWLIPDVLLLGIFALGKGIISDLFRISFFKRMGDISFECFLLHQIVIYQYLTNSSVGKISRLGNWFSLIYCLVVTILLSEFVTKIPRKK